MVNELLLVWRDAQFRFGKAKHREGL
jgi:hypothetical protein